MLHARWSRNQAGQLVATWTQHTDTVEPQQPVCAKPLAEVIPLGRYLRLAKRDEVPFLSVAS